ncbi:hypothetical protein R1flu_020001 [Riccia fluitans]|uniref:Uncharacterized protein n=1 Tax=Riccia fluitans TaxID=41844 RepID=A0ABD1ZKH6_9MARC
MAWSPDNAARAYLDTIRLCKLDHQQGYTTLRHQEPHSTELLAALAAGMKAQLLVEVCSSAAPSTIALAAAARQTGGRLICILSDSNALLDAMVAMKELKLAGVVEFIVGDAKETVRQYTNVDFALVDCKEEDCAVILDRLNLNPTCAVVVADNLFDRSATSAYANFMKKRPGASSIALPIGKGIKVTRFSRAAEAQLVGLDDVKSCRKSSSSEEETRRTSMTTTGAQIRDEKRMRGRRVRFFIEEEVQSDESEDGWSCGFSSLNHTLTLYLNRKKQGGRKLYFYSVKEVHHDLVRLERPSVYIVLMEEPNSARFAETKDMQRSLLHLSGGRKYN